MVASRLDKYGQLLVESNQPGRDRRERETQLVECFDLRDYG